jgi:hypothetical protein
MSDQVVARPIPEHWTTQTQNKHIHQTSMPCVGFEPTIPASKRAKTVHALDRWATVTGCDLTSSNRKENGLDASFLKQTKK